MRSRGWTWTCRSSLSFTSWAKEERGGDFGEVGEEVAGEVGEALREDILKCGSVKLGCSRRRKVDEEKFDITSAA